MSTETRGSPPLFRFSKTKSSGRKVHSTISCQRSRLSVPRYKASMDGSSEETQSYNSPSSKLKQPRKEVMNSANSGPIAQKSAGTDQKNPQTMHANSVISKDSPQTQTRKQAQSSVSAADIATDQAVESSQSDSISEEETLAKDLDNLKIRPDESDQVGTSVQEEDPMDDDNDGDYASILQRLKQVLQADKRKPKEVLKPLLDTFDLAGIADYIKQGKAKNIIVMTGAGISVSAGIPDFRSPKTGLYNNLKKFNLPHPQAVFELDYFRERPQAFYQLAKELFPGNFKPTPAHYFITLLHKKGLLLRCFTQNIDSLEKEAKLPASKLVAAHGNFDTAHCISCRKEVSQDIVRGAVDQGKVCTCPNCKGYVKPDIVFFGENLPGAFFTRAKEDFPKADLLIVMGTSLVVNPFASLIDHVGKAIPRVLINRERVGEADAALLLWGQKKGFSFDEKHRDALYLGDCDDAVRQLAKYIGWEADLDSLIASKTASS